MSAPLSITPPPSKSSKVPPPKKSTKPTAPTSTVGPTGALVLSSLVPVHPTLPAAQPPKFADRRSPAYKPHIHSTARKRALLKKRLEEIEEEKLKSSGRAPKPKPAPVKIGALSAAESEDEDKKDYEFLKHRAITLPSFRRLKEEYNKRNIDEEFKDVPEFIDIGPEKPTEEEMKQFRENMEMVEEDEQTMLDRFANNTNIPPDKLRGTIRMRDMMEFVDQSKKDYEYFLNEVQSWINKDPKLDLVYKRAVASYDPYLMDKNNYEDELKKGGIDFAGRYVHARTKLFDDEDDGKKVDEEKIYKAEQLEKIAQLFFRTGNEQLFRNLFHTKEAAKVIRGAKHPKAPRIADTQSALRKIATKEQISTLDPSKIMKDVVQGKYDELLQANTDVRRPGDLIQLKNYFHEIQQKLENDRIATEKGYMTLEDFEKAIAVGWEMMIDAMGRPVSTRKDRYQNIHDVLEAARKSNRKRILYEMNLFNDQLQDIQSFINARPELKVSKYLQALVNRIVQQVNNGDISVETAYGKLNAARHKKRAALKEYDTNYKLTKLTEKEDTKLKEREEEFLKGHHINYSGLVQESPDVKDKADYTSKLRDKGLWAFNDLWFKQGSGPNDRKLEGKLDPADNTNKQGTLIYDLTKTTKRAIHKGFIQLQNALEKDREAIIKTEKWDPNVETWNEQQLFTMLQQYSGEWNKLVRKKSNLADLILNPRQYPTLTFHRTAPWAADKNWLIDKKRTKEEIRHAIDTMKKEYLNLNQLITDVIDYGAKHSETKMITKKDYRETKKLIKPIGKKKVYEPAAMLFELPKAPKELRPSIEFERPDETKAREEKYTFDNIKYAMTAKKEYPETLKTEIGDNVIEYNVKTKEDLARMKSEVGRLLAQGGKLFIIDLKTGRLFPISIDETYTGQTYIFMKDHVKEGGAFALNPAHDSIERHKDELLPYTFMRHDKMMRRLHHIPKREFSHDYRHQMKAALGGGLWKHVKKGINAAAKGVGNYAVNKTVKAVDQFAKASVYEGKNFVKQEKRNFNSIYNAGNTFIRDPSVKNFSSGYYTASNALGKIVMQPVLSSARELANVSTLASNIPGVNIAKYGIEYAIPPLAVADALVQGVKNTGWGSDDKAKYFDAALNAGDALLGTGALKGSFDTSARLLLSGAKVADYLVDSKNH